MSEKIARIEEILLEMLTAKALTQPQLLEKIKERGIPCTEDEVRQAVSQLIYWKRVECNEHTQKYALKKST